jgi:hypothetical protein
MVGRMRVWIAEAGVESVQGGKPTGNAFACLLLFASRIAARQCLVSLFLYTHCTASHVLCPTTTDTTRCMYTAPLHHAQLYGNAQGVPRVSHATFFFAFEWICLFLKVPNEGCFSTKSWPWRFPKGCTKKLLSQSRLFHGHGLRPADSRC